MQDVAREEWVPVRFPAFHIVEFQKPVNRPAEHRRLVRNSFRSNAKGIRERAQELCRLILELRQQLPEAPAKEVPEHGAFGGLDLRPPASVRSQMELAQMRGKPPRLCRCGMWRHVCHQGRQPPDASVPRDLAWDPALSSLPGSPRPDSLELPASQKAKRGCARSKAWCVQQLLYWASTRLWMGQALHVDAEFFGRLRDSVEAIWAEQRTPRSQLAKLATQMAWLTTTPDLAVNPTAFQAFLQELYELVDKLPFPHGSSRKSRRAKEAQEIKVNLFGEKIPARRALWHPAERKVRIQLGSFRKGYATRRLFAWWTYARLIEQNSGVSGRSFTKEECLSGGLFVALLRSRPPGPPTPELRDLAWRLLPAMPLVDLALEDVLQLPEVLGHSWATYELLLGLGHENLQVQLRTMLAYLALRLWEQAPSKERLRRRLASDVSHLLPGIFRLPCGPEPSEGPLHLFAKLMPARRQAGHSIRMDLSPSGLVTVAPGRIEPPLSLEAQLECLAGLLEHYPCDEYLWKLLLAALADEETLARPFSVLRVWTRSRAALWAERFLRRPMPRHLQGLPDGVYMAWLLLVSFLPNGRACLPVLRETIRQQPDATASGERTPWPSGLDEELNAKVSGIPDGWVPAALAFGVMRQLTGLNMEFPSRTSP